MPKLAEPTDCCHLADGHSISVGVIVKDLHEVFQRGFVLLAWSWDIGGAKPELAQCPDIQIDGGLDGSCLHAYFLRTTAKDCLVKAL